MEKIRRDFFQIIIKWEKIWGRPQPSLSARRLPRHSEVQLSPRAAGAWTLQAACNQCHISLQLPFVNLVQKGSLFFGGAVGSSAQEAAAGQRRQTPATQPNALPKPVTCSTQIHLYEGLSGWQRAGASPARAHRSPLATRLTETSWEQSRIKSARPSISGTLQVPRVFPILLNLCCTYAALVCLPE